MKKFFTLIFAAMLSFSLFAEEQILTVAEALETINALEDGAKTADSVYVCGTVTSFTTYAKKADNKYVFTDGYTYTIMLGDLTCYGTYKEKNVPFETETEIAEGDSIIVYGKLQKYVKNEIVTPEMSYGRLERIVSSKNPQTAISYTAIEEKPIKAIKNGQLVIIFKNKMFNALGVVIE